MKAVVLNSILILLVINLSCKNKNEENFISMKDNSSKEIVASKNDSILYNNLNDSTILNFVYGKYDSKRNSALWQKKNILKNFNYNNRDTLVTSIIMTKSYNFKGVMKSIFITKTLSVNDDLNPIIGILEFVKINNKEWKITLNDYFYQSISISGIPIMKLDLISQNDYAVFLKDVEIGGGYITESFALFSKKNNSFKNILPFDDYAENNSGMCAEELNNCYSYNTEYEIIIKKGFFNIKFSTEGTKLLENKIDTINSVKEFVFNNVNSLYTPASPSIR